jgi:hypothetical protein
MTTSASVRSSRGLLALVVLNLLASILHFTDNARHFSDYPEPKWISGPHVVDRLWFLITPLLFAGWCLWERRQEKAGQLMLATYGILGLGVLGHYLYAPPSAMSLRMHLFIWTEALAALAILVWAARDAARAP